MAIKAREDEKRVKRAYKAYVRWLVNKTAGKAPNMKAFLRVFEHSVEVKVVQASGRRQATGAAVRGQVKQFSDRSRGRFVHFLNRLVWPSEKIWFCTLTYPDEFPRDKAVIDADLDAFSKRIRRRFPGVGVVWRREWKPRKSGDSKGEIAPHYHFFAFNTGVDSCAFWDWARLAWVDIIFKHTDGKHYIPALIHGVDVREVEGRRQAIYYVSKYMTKSDTPVPEVAYKDVSVEPQFEYMIPDGETEARPVHVFDKFVEVPMIYRPVATGRMWGYWGAVDASPLIAIGLSLYQLTSLRLIVEQFLADTGSAFLHKFRWCYTDWMGFTVYADCFEFGRFFLNRARGWPGFVERVT